MFLETKLRAISREIVFYYIAEASSKLDLAYVVCLSLLLEGETAISNNFTKRRQNDFKIGARDKNVTHLR